MTSKTKDLIEKAIQNEVEMELQKVLEDLNEKREQVCHLLHNRTVLETSYGRTFTKIHEQRRILWHKVFTLDTAIRIVIKHFK